MDAEPVGRREQINDRIQRVVPLKRGEIIGLDLDEKAIVTDQLIAEHEGLRSGHVAVDGFLFEELFKLFL